MRSLILVSLFCVIGSNAVLAQRGVGPGQMIQLKEQLETGLKARRPVEFQYIQQVVNAVEQNQLPQSLVRSSFQYARKQEPYPFQYFQRALRIRAARMGLQAP